MKTNTSIMAGAAAVAALAGVGLFNRDRATTAERATPPEGQFVTIDDVRLHYVARGDGPVVVLLHGMGALLQDFEGAGVIERLAVHYRVIAVPPTSHCPALAASA